MPLTNAERCKRYREKQKNQDPSTYRLGETVRKAKYRDRLKEGDPQKLELLRKRDRERKQKTKTLSTPSQPLPEQAAFSCPQSLGRSVQKVRKSLPKSTPKKMAVLANMVSSMSPASKGQLMDMVKVRRQLCVNTGVCGRPPAFKEEQRNWIISFCERPDISYTCPGRKDQVCIGKGDDGNKKYHCKHYLLWKLKEIVPLMNDAIVIDAENGKVSMFTVTYGSLWRLLKNVKHIKYQNEVPENTCTCEYCENMEFLLKALRMIIDDENLNVAIATPVALIDRICCEGSECSDCIDGNHENCGIENPEFQSLCQEISNVQEVSVLKWVSGERFPEKKTCVLTGSEAANELQRQIKAYLRHNYNNHRQHKELRLLKASLDPTTVVIQVDFSENYVNKQANAIQSAYFGQEGFSLYTACVWFRANDETKCKSFCFVSEEMEHNKYVAFHCNSLLITYMREHVPDLHVVHFWSDGCGGQFKSKFCFALLGRYPQDLKITWNYFESHHGKGPVDGIGGSVKTAMYRDVKACKVVFSSAQQFADYATQHVKGITIVYVAKDDIELRTLEDDLIHPVPGTLKVHHVDRFVESDKFRLDFYANSCFFEPALKMHSLFYENKVPMSLVAMSSANGDGKLHKVSSVHDTSVNDFIICVYGNEWWIGKVVNISQELADVLISFMHPCGPRTTFHWPSPSDECWVALTSVLGKLAPCDWPMPTMGSRNFCIEKSVSDAAQAQFVQP